MENNRIQEYENEFEKIHLLKSIIDQYDFSFPVRPDFDYNAVSRNCILRLIDEVVEIKEEGENLVKFLDESDFWIAPASTKFHGDFKYGLSFHSICVLRQALCFAESILANFNLSKFSSQYFITAQDIFVAAISHDFCKTDFYCIEYRNAKDLSGNWIKKPVYKAKTDTRNLGHGNESVLKLLKVMPSFINRRHVIEAVSMHMGFSDISESQTYNYSNFLQNPLLVLLQLADETASAWFEC